MRNGDIIADSDSILSYLIATSIRGKKFTFYDIWIFRFNCILLNQNIIYILAKDNISIICLEAIYFGITRLKKCNNFVGVIEIQRIYIWTTVPCGSDRREKELQLWLLLM